MKTHIIENGIVFNTILATVADAQVAFPSSTCVNGGSGGIGWLWDGETLTAPPAPPPTRDQLKAQRTAAVAAITVTTASGNTFDGDETSQERMARAILVMQATATPSTMWVLHDNTPATVTAAELVEALALSGAAQSALWVLA